MTVVNIATGEIVEVMTEAEARVITSRIRSLAESIADRVDLLAAKVREARDGQAHAALGYGSWTAYVSAEFADVLPRLDREPRRELVAALAETGMSTRAIAPVVNASQRTISNDLSNVAHLASAHSVAETGPEGERDVPSVQSRPPVTGLDGKTYTRPTPKTTPRRALPDQFFDAAFDLSKAVDRVARLADDDRFPQNAEKVAAKHRDDLIRARDALDGVIARMP